MSKTNFKYRKEQEMFSVECFAIRFDMCYSFVTHTLTFFGHVFLDGSNPSNLLHAYSYVFNEMKFRYKVSRLYALFFSCRDLSLDFFNF